MQSEYAQVVSSGTAALTVALACCGVGYGDEVIIPTFTFVASFEAVLSVGAIPVLCDIDETLGLCPKAVEAAITSKTKVIMPVHMCGSMADLKPLKQICDKHDLLLIEDACQAIGGTYEGKPLGSYGDVGCFSFDYVKTITCGEGGGLITDDYDIANRAHKYQDHGHDHIGMHRGAENHPFLGYNYRISEMHAAVGIAQLKKIDHILDLQKKNYDILKEVLLEYPEIEFRKVPENGVQSYAFVNFLLPNEETARSVQAALEKYNAEGCFYWYDNNWHYYKKWHHLMEPRSVNRLSDVQMEGLRKNDKTYSQSDTWMSRTISCLVKINRSERQIDEQKRIMRTAFNSVLKEHTY